MRGTSAMLSGALHGGALALAALALAGCKQASPAASIEVGAVFLAQLPRSPASRDWRAAPVHQAKLLVQDMVDPRLMKPSTAAVDVQAATDGKRITFRLRWPDATKNDLPGSARFADACAVQLPAKQSADVPAPQMGEAGKRVLISYWSAFWQATVDGRPDKINAIYPGARVDHYPFEAPALKKGSPPQKAAARRYAPARALGNPMAGPRKQPVQDLVAEGPGTLKRVAGSTSTGGGKHDGKGWSVVLSRPLPPGVVPGKGTQVALAIWQGEAREVGARKMRSVWIPLKLEGAR